MCIRPYLALYSNRMRSQSIYLLVLFSLISSGLFAKAETHIRKKFEIQDGIAPKSVVTSGNGLFAAQNMMYRHTVTLYNGNGDRISKINDAVQLTSFGINKYGAEKFRGAPVEGVFSKDGNYLWVSNYHMSGASFTNPGCDNCIGTAYDPSFIYKINTQTFEIEQVIEVGSVPKFIAISSQEKWLLVSNWVSSDVSIIDLMSETEIKRITVGTHPRGIAITQDEKQAYVTVMGSTKLVEIDLETFATKSIEKIGKSPRSILLAQHDSILYISMNGSNELVKYNRHTSVRKVCKTAAGPRSMTLSPDEKSLYVVNYFDNVFTKINTDSMQIEAEVKTADKPIGICGNWKDAEIWVACYSGKIEVFKDFKLERTLRPKTFFGITWPQPLPLVTDTSTSATGQPQPDQLVQEIKRADARKYPKLSQDLAKERLPITPLEKGSSFHIIVGAFSIRENAVDKQTLLSASKINATIIEGMEFTYVSVGSYANELEAIAAKNKFISAHPEEKSAWILSK